MNTNTELELRPLDEHELETVSGGLAARITFANSDYGFFGPYPIGGTIGAGVNSMYVEAGRALFGWFTFGGPR